MLLSLVHYGIRVTYHPPTSADSSLLILSDRFFVACVAVRPSTLRCLRDKIQGLSGIHNGSPKIAIYDP
jgi:hypothetical protein